MRHRLPLHHLPAGPVRAPVDKERNFSVSAHRLAQTLRAAVALASCALVACSSGGTGTDGDGGPGDTFDRKLLLQSAAHDVIVPTLEAFLTEAQALEIAAAAWATAETQGDGSAERQAAQDAWRNAMAVWQRAEVMQIGPAGLPTTFTGGKGLRDAIYSWPYVLPCAVDHTTEDQSYNNLPAKKLVYPFGLDALEYLLFVPTANNACDAGDSINQGPWDALSADEITNRRAAYAQAAAAKVAADAQTLLDAWKDGFTTDLTGAGSSGSSFSTAQAAIDELFAALYYIELHGKDRKLAIPAGIHASCASTPCGPEQVESPWAKASRDHLRQNLAGVRALFYGTLDPNATNSAVGFDDFLNALDGASTAADFEDALAAIEARLDAKSTTLYDEVSAQSNEAQELYNTLKGLTDIIKSEMVTVLNLKVPAEGAGDND